MSLMPPTDAIAELERESELEHAHSEIDELERAMLAGIESGDLVLHEFPVTHTFTPGLYSRRIFMAADTRLTSRIHNTDHQYVVLEGVVRVYIPGGGIETIVAPFAGVTRAGTRRVLRILADCTWVTFHPTTPEEDAEPDEAKRLAMIHDRIIERRDLGDGTGRTAFEAYAAAIDEQRTLEAASCGEGD